MIGSRLGPYEITAKLGAGGMGEVYRATDTKLGREVAIKVLPAAFTADRERLARFEREARLLAQLNHPNIAAIYGLEDAGGVRALILELVEGPTLAERLRAESLSLYESLSISLQIAQALEEAHEKGIVHRDLKPQNIKASIEGKVKVLDFGLAKAMEPLSSRPETPSQFAQSPTLTFGATLQGVILGTAAYMSPEQAKGVTVDKRADIWAFGVVLYEMLCGRSLFSGDSIPDTLARVLQLEIDWSAVPDSVPPAIQRLLRRCLQRNPKNRLHDIADARLVLEEVVRGDRETSLAGVAPAVDARRPLLFRLWPIALLLVAAASVLAGRYLAPTKAPASRAPLRVSLLMPPELEVDSGFLTRDGSSLLFSARRRDDPHGELALYRRRLDSFESTQIPGTIGIIVNAWDLSPDSQWLDILQPTPADDSKLRLLRVPLDGSAPPLERMTWNWTSNSWFYLENGDLIALLLGMKLQRIAGRTGAEGPPVPIDVGRDGEISATWSSAVPGDRRALLNQETKSASSNRVGTVLVDTATGKGTVVLENGGNARYVESGHLLFSRGPVLLGARFDLDTGRLSTTPLALEGDLRAWAPATAADFDLSPDGTLLFAPGGIVIDNRRLVVLTPGEKVLTPWNQERRAFTWGPPGSDEQSAFVTLIGASGFREIWRIPRDGPGQPLVASGDADVAFPAVSADGSLVAFRRRGWDAVVELDLLSIRDGGSPRTLRKFASPGDEIYPVQFFAGNSRLLMSYVHEGKESGVELQLGEGAPTELRVLLPAEPWLQVELSRDERWLAFGSPSSGRAEVYLAAYHRDGPLGPRRAVSRQGGAWPEWSPDGKRLYFVDPEARLLVAEVSAEGTFVGEPTVAADLRALRLLDAYEVLADGKLLFVQKGEEEEGIRQFDLILGFGEELKRRIP